MISTEYTGPYLTRYEGVGRPLDNSEKLVLYELVTPQDSQVMPTDNYEHADTTTISRTFRSFRGGSAKRSTNRGNNGIVKRVKKLFA
ncbi:hypothetical protein ZYGR_0P00540 [Zygosaccharomyces rouxii]|uniref:ZYRO0E01386p n=2 Tax=Zygosaccharomyces rouxii TaxID=4956 RepID=C5E3Z1_ZYGRC|nr:uncharacterized protein ZYRO0E01386g [Zygosaccharomyces rouxii]GAV49411.1 hypothetical protein ZYGR_0P00540 [Zygosaccharomyces rouxii]CAR30752.1 ZYRO0E01386p [Zygosaccharomyces rouxii]